MRSFYEKGPHHRAENKEENHQKAKPPEIWQCPGRGSHQCDPQADGGHIDWIVKAQTDGKEDQDTDHLGPWIEAMYPGAFVKIKEDVHSEPVNTKWKIGNDK
jgi:hypothetical protein